LADQAPPWKSSGVPAVTTDASDLAAVEDGDEFRVHNL